MRKVRTTSGATVVQIMHKRGRRVLGIDHIGSARTEAEVALLEAVARKRLHAGQGELPLQPGGTSAPAAATGMEATVTGTAPLVLWQALERVYVDLGFDVLGDEAFKQLVLARIVEPTSKADTVRVLADIGVPSRTRETFMRCLTRVVERNYRDQLGAACYAHAAPTGALTAVLYDLTTLLCRRRHKRCTSRRPRRTRCARSACPRRGEWTRRSRSGCCATRAGSRWRCTCSRATRQRPRPSSRCSRRSRPLTTSRT